MEDEIDLRQYVAVLLRHWKLIIILTALAGVVALAVGLLTPQLYEAKSRVSILKVDAVLLPDGTPQDGSGIQMVSKAYGDLLLLLAKSNMIADEVAGDASGNNRFSDLAAGKVMAAVQAKQQGNSIEFTVQHSDPAKAAFIANAWAERYTAYIDNYFRSTGQTAQEARSYADSIRKIYIEKQKALHDFEASNHIGAIESEISDRDVQLIELTGQRDAALKAYQAALVKISNAEIAHATSGGYVRVADKALEPDAPLPDSKKWLNVIIALVIGLIVGVIGAFVIEYFNKTAKKTEDKSADAG